MLKKIGNKNIPLAYNVVLLNSIFYLNPKGPSQIIYYIHI